MKHIERFMTGLMVVSLIIFIVAVFILVDSYQLSPVVTGSMVFLTAVIIYGIGTAIRK